ncbi:TPA: hypothetical protein ACFP4U_000301 [Neisseria lactamica]|uniref:hypothetical protein n=1 Tax=Neisseria lactamica TaxID=486 RepID=UPI001EFC80BE|nr:hypothetical protein [Neisseria lactamica]
MEKQPGRQPLPAEIFATADRRQNLTHKDALKNAQTFLILRKNKRNQGGFLFQAVF